MNDHGHHVAIRLQRVEGEHKVSISCCCGAEAPEEVFSVHEAMDWATDHYDEMRVVDEAERVVRSAAVEEVFGMDPSNEHATHVHTSIFREGWMDGIKNTWGISPMTSAPLNYETIRKMMEGVAAAPMRPTLWPVVHPVDAPAFNAMIDQAREAMLKRWLVNRNPFLMDIDHWLFPRWTVLARRARREKNRARVRMHDNVRGLAVDWMAWATGEVKWWEALWGHRGQPWYLTPGFMKRWRRG